jgi:hypothetical protein
MTASARATSVSDLWGATGATPMVNATTLPGETCAVGASGAGAAAKGAASF